MITDAFMRNQTSPVFQFAILDMSKEHNAAENVEILHEQDIGALSNITGISKWLP